MQSYKINENISLHYIPMTKLKTTSVGIYIGRNLDRTEASFNALLPSVMIKACQGAEDAGKIAKKLQELYGAKFYQGVSKRAGIQFMNFEGEVISDRFAAGGEKLLKELVHLMLSVVFAPIEKDGGFLADITEREKVNCINKIKGLINDKIRYANKRCLEEMFKGEDYGISEYGYEDEIKNITPRSLYEHYKKIIGESVINIFLCGEVNISEIEDEIKNAVAGIDFKKASGNSPAILQKSGDAENITETTELTQGKLAMGFRTNISCNDEKMWSLIVANNIYGGGLGSKLFNNVREKLSLAYYVSTMIDRYNGFMLLYAGIAFDKFDEAKSEIFFQLDEMKKGNITEDEMENAKSEIINGINSCYDNQQLLASYYMGNIISGADVSIEEYKENIRKVTKEQVIDAISGIELDTVYFLKGEVE